MKPFSLLSVVRPGTHLTIMDVGASLSEDPPYMPLVNDGVARIIAFEPNRHELDELIKRFGNTHQFFPHFVGDGKPAIFYETNWFATGSLFKPNKPLLELYQNLSEVVTLRAEHPVQTVAIDAISEIEDVDYIKIDVQGSELSILQNATRVLAGVTIIQTEVNFVELYEKQPLFSDLDPFLRRMGFQLLKFHGFGTRPLKPVVIDNNPNRGPHLLWADAIYIRDLLRLDEVTTEKLIKLALILHDVYQLCDCALYILRIVDGRTRSQFADRYLERLMAN